MHDECPRFLLHTKIILWLSVLLYIHHLLFDHVKTGIGDGPVLLTTR